MQYSPKLKKAMEQIKKILADHDIAAVVVLHTPGYAEYFLKINPSYSCAWLEQNLLRVKAKLQEDFKGDKVAWKKKITDTSNMLNMLSEVTMNSGMGLLEVSQQLDKLTNADHGNSRHTPDNEANN